MITVTDAWWATMMRGAAALTLALIVAVQAHVATAMAPILFGTYVLVDGIIAAGGMIAAGLGKCGVLLLIEGLTGITLGMASIYESHAMSFALPLFMIIWALVIGGSEMFTGGQVGSEMPNFRERRRLRRTLTPSRTYLLSGALTLSLAIALAVVPIFRTILAIPLLGLFAASFGYLHLCSGLILGLRVVEQASAEDHPDADPELLVTGSFAFQQPN
jgi:uncharacterized membrane protein HdeD (DUF308 family)